MPIPTTLAATSITSHLATSVAVAAGTPISVATDLATMIKPFTPDALANGFATLIGALIGAMLAYALQRRFQKSIQHRNDHAAAHRLMFALLQQINTIILIQRDYIYNELENPGRYLSIPATPPFDTVKNVLQLPELAFLLDTKEGRAILYDFYVAQENYIEALNQWNIRSALHVEKVQPTLVASDLASGATITEDVLRHALGAHLFGSIFNSTENCIESLQRAFQKLSEIKVKARAYLVLRFSSDDFTDFNTPETYGLAAKLSREE